jgi:hypothetical protein
MRPVACSGYRITSLYRACWPYRAPSIDPFAQLGCLFVQQIDTAGRTGRLCQRLMRIASSTILAYQERSTASLVEKEG